MPNPPIIRPRRLRHRPALRRLVQETTLQPSDFIYPLFIHHAHDYQGVIESMPGQFQWSLDKLPAQARELAHLGISAVLLFGIPAQKDPYGRENYNPQGLIPQAIQILKETTPDLLVISDLCFCEYTDHGHCGIINQVGDPHYRAQLPEGYLLNDPTLELLGQAAVVHAQAGADIIAPSGMMDGTVGHLRASLDAAGFEHTAIMSYAIKYASGFYGPFRHAAQSAPTFGDRHHYQMNPANGREALHEAQLDIEQGADILMVKPALPYLDVISQLHASTQLPIAAYQVSGEYAMLHAAAANGWLDLQRCALESLTSIKRAGAQIIISYFAKEVCQWIHH
jgi:porphobilinogen synthase